MEETNGNNNALGLSRQERVTIIAIIAIIVAVALFSSPSSAVTWIDLAVKVAASIIVLMICINVARRLAGV